MFNNTLTEDELKSLKKTWKNQIKSAKNMWRTPVFTEEPEPDVYDYFDAMHKADGSMEFK